jgi:hypothetical protein
VQLGSLVGDALWAVLGLVGVGILLQLEWLREQWLVEHEERGRRWWEAGEAELPDRDDAIGC